MKGNPNDWMGGVVILLFGSVTALLSLQLPLGTFRMAGSGLIPLCLGILLVLLSAVHLLQNHLRRRRQGGAEKVVVPASVFPVLLFSGSMILAAIFLKVIGYFLVSFLLVFSLLGILGAKRWLFNAILSLVMAVAAHLLFVQWLKIPLPKGWIGL
jgi:putative tricarboxylic transport membrane protein